MQLAMTVLRCPDHVAPEARTISGGEFHVGRGPDVDWVLPDPDRLLSKRHFAVAFRGGAWQVADTSTNGTYLNTDPEAIGRGATRTLENGDRLRLGAYEIEIRLVDEAAQGDGFGGGFGAQAGGGGMPMGGQGGMPMGGASSRNSPFADPFGEDLLAPPPPPRQPFGGFENSPLGAPQTAAQLPHDFDPLAPDAHDDFAAGFRGPTQSDHSPLGSDAFTPPPVAGYVLANTGGAIPGVDDLPDDWDKDLLEGINPPSGAPAAAQPAAHPAAPAFGAPLPATAPFGAAPVAAPPFDAPHPAVAPFAAPHPAEAPFSAPQPAAAAFGAPLPAGAPFGAPQPAAAPFAAPHPAEAPFGAAQPAAAPFAAPHPAASPFGAEQPGAQPAARAASPQPAAWAEPAPHPAAAPFGAAQPGGQPAAPQSAAPQPASSWPAAPPPAAWAEPAEPHGPAGGVPAAAPLDDLDDFLADLEPPPVTAAPAAAPSPAVAPVASPPVVRQRAPRPTAQPQAEPDPFVDQTIGPAAGAAAAQIPVQSPVQAPVQAPVQMEAAPTPAPTASPFDEPADFIGLSEPVAAPRPVEPPRAGQPPAQAPATAQMPAAAAPPVAPPSSTMDTGGALAAFFKGAQLNGVNPADPLATMTELGAAFRAVVAGMRAVLIARATIKGEFRIEQTMIRARGNNPLKFSANDDDALTALLGVGRRTDMSPTAAIEESMRDMRLHEVATMAAMQVAVRAMLEELSPDKLRATAEQGGGMSVLPAQRKARAWDAFEARHRAVVQALVDDFDSIFGKSFARAYERALDEISQRERQ